MAKNIQTVVMSELWKSHTDGFLPILIEIYNEDLVWGDNSNAQESMYLRVVNDTQRVKYRGHTYIPCQFEMSQPEEDGKTLKPASLTISAVDSRIIQLLRSCDLKSEVNIVACYAKKTIETEQGKSVDGYAFYPLTRYSFKISGAQYTRTTAALTLAVEDIMTLQVARDKATQEKFPALNTEG